MIHYSCDRCQRSIDPHEDRRYVIQIEVQSALEPLAADQTEDDRDHLAEIQEILLRMEDDGEEPTSDELPQKRRYDLCARCYSKFVRNPLGCEPATQLGYSSN